MLTVFGVITHERSSIGNVNQGNLGTIRDNHYNRCNDFKLITIRNRLLQGRLIMRPDNTIRKSKKIF